MQGVRGTVGGDRPPGRDEGLGGDLAAEDPGHDRGTALAAEDVLLDPLQGEQTEQGLQCVVHVRAALTA